MTQLKLFVISLVVFIIPFLIPSFRTLNSMIIQSEDTVPTIFTTIAIVKDRSLYLDPYYEMMRKRYPHPDDKDYKKGLTPFYLQKIGNHYLSAFPIMTSIISVPVFVLPILLGMPMTWENLALLGHISGALIMSLAGLFLFKTLKEGFSLEDKKSGLLTIIFLFATVNFAMLSQAMWQHGTLQLFTILGIYFFLKQHKYAEKYEYTLLSGLFFGLAFLARPTAGLPIVLIELYLIFSNLHKIDKLFKVSVTFLLGLLIAFSFFLWYNSAYYYDIQNQGYSDQIFKSWLSPFPLSFIGVWISPSKGILIFSPVLIFSFVGLYLAIKNKIEKIGLYGVFAAIVILHTLVISFWKHWYGGWSFGYRMSSDVLPYFIFLLVPYINSDLFQRTKKIFLILLFVSILIEIYGLFFFDGIWHAAYDLGYEDTSWLWSIKDSQFLFDIRRVLVKFGLLSSACPKCL
ncbi:MAG: hypothetical protein KatS3mg101_0337 [Patescibacteria group bacterium]|nr:MAG: hypothetical protein KatS3mg101_0337 [Patescibacteria group bacterium]